MILKNCAPFTGCISYIDNTEIDNAKDIYFVMPMYNLLEYSDNYLKISGTLWQYYRYKPSDQIVNHSNPRLKWQEILLIMVIQKNVEI